MRKTATTIKNESRRKSGEKQQLKLPVVVHFKAVSIVSIFRNSNIKTENDLDIFV
jgi:hypothetical protein